MLRSWEGNGSPDIALTGKSTDHASQTVYNYTDSAAAILVLGQNHVLRKLVEFISHNDMLFKCLVADMS